MVSVDVKHHVYYPALFSAAFFRTEIMRVTVFEGIAHDVKYRSAPLLGSDVTNCQTKSGGACGVLSRRSNVDF